MRICFLAPADSSHTEKWCRYFVSRGHEVHVVSFTGGNLPGVHLHVVNTNARAEGSDMQKLLYLTKAGEVRKLVRKISPDIVNVHYATSYGTVAALAGLKNYVLSVWGSDIFDFPNHSVLHRQLLKFSLSRAAHLFSTSQAMADEASNYTSKHFDITPFGVDMTRFSPDRRSREWNASEFVLGTVKGLAPAYGIDTFLRAVHIVVQQYPEIPVRVRIAGSGPCEEEYHRLAESLGLRDRVEWLGHISQEKAAEEWANMDTAVICSNHESFGVAAVEAQACGCPVIISDIPGLMEATKPNETSIVVPRKNAEAIADTIIDLYRHPEQRLAMGKAGEKYVREHYEIEQCFDHIEALLDQYRSNKESAGQNHRKREIGR